MMHSDLIIISAERWPLLTMMLIVNTRPSSPVTDLMTMGYWARGTKLIKYFGRNLTSSSETDHDIGKTFMITE